MSESESEPLLILVSPMWNIVIFLSKRYLLG